MSVFSMKNAKFIKTAIRSSDYPVLRDLSGKFLPEIAVAGRSNVGKSSLLNHLFQSRDLVKTSSVPGKTQALNFFRVGDQAVFVDLPGYGYAQVPLKMRKAWGPMVQTYLEKRETLKLVLLLLDIRRVPNDDDQQMLDWAIQAEKSVVLILTKTDKVTVNEKEANTAKILMAFDAQNLHYVHYSVTKNVGHKELISKIKDVLEI